MNRIYIACNISSVELLLRQTICKNKHFIKEHACYENIKKLNIYSQDRRSKKIIRFHVNVEY